MNPLNSSYDKSSPEFIEQGNRSCSLKVHVYIACFNEEILLPHTIAHYRRQFPNTSIQFTILDNLSTDRSVEIAREVGCNVHSFGSEDIMNEFILTENRNHFWKNPNTLFPKGGEDGETEADTKAEGDAKVEGDGTWIFMIDMDEWLCIDETQLRQEQERGTTIIRFTGYNVVGESQSADLLDILPDEIHRLKKGIRWPSEDKSLCFRIPFIQEMNYAVGAHSCDPKGQVVYSETAYLNKHMAPLGLAFITKRYEERYKRSKWFSQMFGMNGHYHDNVEKMKNEFHQWLLEAVPLPV